MNALEQAAAELAVATITRELEEQKNLQKKLQPQYKDKVDLKKLTAASLGRCCFWSWFSVTYKRHRCSLLIQMQNSCSMDLQ